MNEIITQTIYYAIVMLITLTFMGFNQKGFFWKHLKVRLSFGSKFLVNIRNPYNSYFKIGKIEDNMIKYEDMKEKKKFIQRVVLPDRTPFYKSMGVSVVDIDEKTNGILMPDFKAIEGYDPVSFDSMLKRAIYAPQELDRADKIMIGLLVGVLIAAAICAYFMYRYNGDFMIIKNGISQIIQTTTVIPPPAPI